MTTIRSKSPRVCRETAVFTDARPTLGKVRDVLCAPAAALRRVAHVETDLLAGLAPVGQAKPYITALALGGTAYYTTLVSELLLRPTLSFTGGGYLQNLLYRVPAVGLGIVNLARTTDVLAAQSDRYAVACTTALAVGELLAGAFSDPRDAATFAAACTALAAANAAMDHGVWKKAPIVSSPWKPLALQIGRTAQALATPLHLMDPAVPMRQVAFVGATVGAVVALNKLLLAPFTACLAGTVGGTLGRYAAPIASFYFTRAAAIDAVSVLPNFTAAKRFASLEGEITLGLIIGTCAGRPISGAALGAMASVALGGDGPPANAMQMFSALAAALWMMPNAGEAGWLGRAVSVAVLAIFGTRIDLGCSAAGALAALYGTSWGGAWGWAGSVAAMTFTMMR